MAKYCSNVFDDVGVRHRPVLESSVEGDAAFDGAGGLNALFRQRLLSK